MGEQILLMTRPIAAGRNFVARLDVDLLEGVTVIYAPLIAIVRAGPCPALNTYAGVIFTSANGVDAAPQADGLPCYCVGQRTATHAKLSGYDVQIIAQDADHLVQHIATSGVSGPLVHLSGAHTRGDIAGRLTASALQVTEHVVYDQPLLPLSAQAQDALSGEVPVILPLFSPRTAAHLAGQMDVAHGTVAIGLSAAVSDQLDPTLFAKIHTAPHPTGKDMVQGIEKLLCHNSLS